MNKQQVLKKLQVLNDQLHAADTHMRVLSDVISYRECPLDFKESERAYFEMDMERINKRIEKICRQHEDFKKNMDSLLNDKFAINGENYENN